MCIECIECRDTRLRVHARQCMRGRHWTAGRLLTVTRSTRSDPTFFPAIALPPKSIAMAAAGPAIDENLLDDDDKALEHRLPPSQLMLLDYFAQAITAHDHESLSNLHVQHQRQGHLCRTVFRQYATDCFQISTTVL